MDDRLAVIDLGERPRPCALAIAPGGCSRWLAVVPAGQANVEICRNCAAYLAQRLSWHAVRGGRWEP